MASMIRQLGLSRFDFSYATGRVPFEQRLSTIELFGREVVPRVKELLTEAKYDPTPTERSVSVAPGA
jgi:hypothetical protein